MNHQENDPFEFFQFRKVLGVARSAQIFLVSTLYTLMTLGYYFSVQKTGKMDGYSPGVSLLFVPIYEELLFRGVFLKFFDRHYGKVRAIIFVSLLFGLLHLKNIFWLDLSSLVNQIGYTALIFSPITCWITLKYRTLWPAVILHYLNNFPIEAWIQKFH